MAELLLKVRNDAYEEGDIICAFNDRSISCKHLEHECHPWKNGQQNGLRISSSVVNDFYRHTHQYKFERISRHQIRRITLANGQEEIITGPEFDVTINRDKQTITFNLLVGARDIVERAIVLAAQKYGEVRYEGNINKINNLNWTGTVKINGLDTSFVVQQLSAEHMYVEDYVNFALKERTPDGGPKASIFGTPGNEYWYGGDINLSSEKLSLIWTDVENKKQISRLASRFRFWPLGNLELRHFLAIPTDNFNDATANDLVSDLRDGNVSQPNIIKKRKHRVNWREFIPTNVPFLVTQQDVENPNKEIDIRDRPPILRSMFVRTKSI